MTKSATLVERQMPSNKRFGRFFLGLFVSSFLARTSRNLWIEDFRALFFHSKICLNRLYACPHRQMKWRKPHCARMIRIAQMNCFNSFVLSIVDDISLIRFPFMRKYFLVKFFKIIFQFDDTKAMNGFTSRKGRTKTRSRILKRIESEKNIVLDTAMVH